MRHLRKVCIGCDVRNRYTFSTLVGKGSFAKVNLAIRKKDQAKFAIKSIKKALMFKEKRNLGCLIKEIQVQRMVNHPNAIKLYEVYESDMYIHLVLEYINSGDLLNHINTKGTYSEKDASTLAFKILGVLEYCHARNIIHRDLKLENLMVMYVPLTPLARIIKATS